MEHRWSDKYDDIVIRNRTLQAQCDALQKQLDDANLVITYYASAEHPAPLHNVAEEYLTKYGVAK